MKRLVTIFLSVLLACGLILSGCSGNSASNAPTTGESSGTETADNGFKAQITFLGSSTLAPVISSIATNFIEEHSTWDKVDPSFPAETIAIYVSAGGSGAGVKAVLDGTADFGMLARDIKNEELEKIGDANVFKLGIDALTISVNPENPILSVKDNLTTEELRKIFSGEYKYWDELDSSLPHNEIVVVTRDLGGGAHEVFQNAIMGDTQVRADAIQAPSMGALVAKIIENKDCIGYASFGMVNQNAGKLVPLKVDGVEPTEENIINGSYKISRPLIAVKKGALTPAQEAFMNVVKSDAGAAVIEEMGFIPVR